ncbi:MAG: cytochrome c [Bacteroidota bacterium]
MKKITIALLLIGSTLFIYRCTSSKKTTATATTKETSPVSNEITNEKILVEAQKKSSAITLANITNGVDVYNNKCFNCHGAKGGIEGHSATEWVSIIDRMAPKSKLTAEEKNNLSHYILAKKELMNAK